jgi:hypothetical protein
MESAMWITAIATAVIALNALMSYRLVSRIQTRDNDFRQQLRDLYEAIVISNLLFSETGLDRRLALFEGTYQGKTPISVKSRKDIS